MNTGANKMRKKRNMPQMKQQEKTPENKLNGIEASNLQEYEFKTVVMRMLKELRGRMDEHNENLSREKVSIKKDIETIKESQTEKKNALEEFNSRFDKKKIESVS